MYINTLNIFRLGATRRVRSRVIGWISVSLAVLTGSTSIVFAKQLTEAFSPLMLLLLSESIALLFTVLSFGLIPLVKELLKAKQGTMLPLISVGLTSSVLAPLLIFAGLEHTEAANAELFLRTDHLFLFVLATIFLHEKISRTHIMAGCIVMLGIITVAFRGFSVGFTFASGDILVLSGAIMYANGAILFKKYLSHLHPEVVLFFRGCIAVAFFLLAAPATGISVSGGEHTFPFTFIGALIGYSFVSRFIYLMSYYEALERLPVHTVSLIIPLASVGSLVFAALYLGESIEWYHIFGGLLILLGSIVIQFSSKHLKGKHLRQHLHQHHRRHV